MSIIRGQFTSEGKDKFINAPGADWIKVENLTKLDTATNATLCRSYFDINMTGNYQYGMGDTREATIDALIPNALTAATKIAQINTNDNPLSAVDTTVTAVSADTPPQVTVTSTADYKTGDIVRFRSVTGATQLNGMDFTITNLNATTFSLPFMATIVAGTTGSFYKVKYPEVYYPAVRFITGITQATQAVVTLSVSHNYEIGDKVKLKVPEEFGMVEINNKIVEIVDKTASATVNTITIDLDTSSYTAFSFPLTGVTLPQYAQAIPISRAIIDSSFSGFELKAGATAAAGPAGADGDVIRWYAGTFESNLFTD